MAINSMTGPSSSEDEARQLRLRREKLYEALQKSEREWESAWDSSREYLRKVRELAMEAAYNMDAGLVNETGDILCRVEEARVKTDNEFEQVIFSIRRERRQIFDELQEGRNTYHG